MISCDASTASCDTPSILSVPQVTAMTVAAGGLQVPARLPGINLAVGRELIAEIAYGWRPRDLLRQGDLDRALIGAIQEDVLDLLDTRFGRHRHRRGQSDE